MKRRTVSAAARAGTGGESAPKPDHPGYRARRIAVAISIQGQLAETKRTVGTSQNTPPNNPQDPASLPQKDNTHVQKQEAAAAGAAGERQGLAQQATEARAAEAAAERSRAEQSRSQQEAAILGGSKRLAQGASPTKEVAERLEAVDLAANTLIERSAAIKPNFGK